MQFLVWTWLTKAKAARVKCSGVSGYLRVSATHVCERFYCLQTQWAWRPYVIVHDNLPRALPLSSVPVRRFTTCLHSPTERCVRVFLTNSTSGYVCVCVCVSSVVLWLLSHLLTSFLSPCTSRLSNLLLLISGNWNIFCWCLNLLQCEYKCGTNNSLWSLHVNLSLWSSLECCDYQGIFYFFVCQENSFFYCVHYSLYHHWCFLSEHYKTQICTFLKSKKTKEKLQISDQRMNMKWRHIVASKFVINWVIAVVQIFIISN